MSISISGLSFSYNGNSALSNISFDIEDKDFIAIIGRNGSGKTTLIKLMLGLLELQQGDIKISGRSIRDFKDWDVIGYVPQKYNIDKNFPANVDELLSLRTSSRKSQIAELLNIRELLWKKFSELSGGQQQRVIIAMSLMSGPKILILDEPTVGVDIKAQQDFYSMLKKLNADLGVTIVLVTHDVSLIPKYVKNVVCLNGNVCCCGKPHETEKLLKSVYGKDFTIHHHHD